MDKRDREKARNILMLLLDNNHTSASKEGLRHRAVNRSKAIVDALNLLNITQEESTDLYWGWRKIRDKDDSFR